MFSVSTLCFSCPESEDTENTDLPAGRQGRHVGHGENHS